MNTKQMALDALKRVFDTTCATSYVADAIAALEADLAQPVDQAATINAGNQKSQDAKDAARYRFIRSQMESGAVRTDLPLTRSIFWVGTYVDCSRVEDACESIDAAIASATGAQS